MSVTKNRAKNILNLMTARFSKKELFERQRPKLPNEKPLKPSIRPTKTPSERALDNYWRILREHNKLSDEDQSILADSHTRDTIEGFSKNIENCIGTLKIPLGIIGPLRVNGIFASDDFYVPLATTEATLVASYARGARLISEAGGCSVALLNDGICRTPALPSAKTRCISRETKPPSSLSKGWQKTWWAARSMGTPTP